MMTKASGAFFCALFLFLNSTLPSLAQAGGGGTAGQSGAADDEKKGKQTDLDKAASCWGYDKLGLSCGIGVSFNLNLGQTSVTATKIVAVTGGHVVQPTTSYNNIAGLIAYITPPNGTSAMPAQDGWLGPKGTEILRCGVFAWIPDHACNPFVAFTVPGTTGGIQQYSFGWKMQFFGYDENTKHLALGIGAAFSSEVPVLDSNIVDATGMVRPAFDSAVASGALSPTKTRDRWGILFMLSTDFD